MKERLNNLEKQGVFINTEYEHYNDGSNLIFSIVFSEYFVGTGAYNDNHEFGDGGDTIEAAIELAEWFLEDVNRIEHIDCTSSFCNHNKGFACDWAKERSKKEKELMNKNK